MSDPTALLAVFVAALAVAGAGALVLADRIVAPIRRAVVGLPSERDGLGRAGRVMAHRGAVAVLIAVLGSIVLAFASNALARRLVEDAVFAAPLLGAAAAIAAYAVMQSRPLLLDPVSTVSSTARRVQNFARRRSVVATAMLGALLILLAVFAATSTPVAAFTGGRAVVLPVGLCALLAASVFAHRRIAARPALPASMSAADRTLRQVASRFVLLLASSAMLTTIGLVAAQSGGWLWENAPVLLASTPAGALLTAAGVVVTVVALLAGVGALATVGALVFATVNQNGYTEGKARTPAAA